MVATYVRRLRRFENSGPSFRLRFLVPSSSDSGFVSSYRGSINRARVFYARNERIKIYQDELLESCFSLRPVEKFLRRKMLPIAKMTLGEVLFEKNRKGGGRKRRVDPRRTPDEK
uniref:Uncharacterized protein n=1 Tax=Vespula pensylvanica TaxID=30213 RepID=A0A834JTP6_VESPE|nr:hypothetical protein H0235_016757 [Vespula pensylvanica]